MNLENRVSGIVDLWYEEPVEVTLTTADPEQSWRVVTTHGTVAVIGLSVTSVTPGPAPLSTIVSVCEVGQQAITVGGLVALPSRFSVRDLVCGLDLPPDWRFFRGIYASANGSVVTGSFRCLDFSQADPVVLRVQVICSQRALASPFIKV